MWKKVLLAIKLARGADEGADTPASSSSTRWADLTDDEEPRHTAGPVAETNGPVAETVQFPYASYSTNGPVAETNQFNIHARSYVPLNLRKPNFNPYTGEPLPQTDEESAGSYEKTSDEANSTGSRETSTQIPRNKDIPEGTTTLMMMNIPATLSRDEIIEDLLTNLRIRGDDDGHHNFMGEFDFVNVAYQMESGANHKRDLHQKKRILSQNLFVNFKSASKAREYADLIRWNIPEYQSPEVVSLAKSISVRAAATQGLEKSVRLAKENIHWRAEEERAVIFDSFGNRTYVTACPKEKFDHHDINKFLAAQNLNINAQQIADDFAETAKKLGMTEVELVSKFLGQDCRHFVGHQVNSGVSLVNALLENPHLAESLGPQGLSPNPHLAASLGCLSPTSIDFSKTGLNVVDPQHYSDVDSSVTLGRNSSTESYPAGGFLARSSSSSAIHLPNNALHYPMMPVVFNNGVPYFPFPISPEMLARQQHEVYED